MMKTTRRLTTVLALFLLASVPAMAQNIDGAIQTWVERASDDCPGSKIELERMNGAPLNGWRAWKVTQTSSDSRCGSARYVLSDGRSIFVGNVFPLEGTGTIESKLVQFGSTRLKKSMTANVAAAASGGLRSASLVSRTEQGPLTYSGWVDPQGQVFLVGRYGALSSDPGQVLVQALGAASGARRGNAMGRIQIVELSDFQCPTCARAHSALEPLIEANLDKISYTRLDLPLFEHHDWVLDAALTARAIQKLAPAKYWDFVDLIFVNQPSITKANVQQVMSGFAEDLGIDWKSVSVEAAKPANKQQLLAQTGKAFDQAIYGTPTFIINGRIMFYDNDAQYIKDRIRQLLGQ